MQKQELQTLSNAVQTAVKEVIARLYPGGGVELGPIRGQYGGAESTLRLRFVESGKAEDEARTDAAIFGIKPEMVGEIFVSGGVQYRLTGFNFRAPKYPLKSERVSDGKNFKHRETSVPAEWRITS